MIKEVDWRCYSTLINKTIRKGIFITAKDGEKVNTMTIGWGSIGYCWSRPIFTAYVRKSRFTAPLILNSKEFTINIPLDDCDPKFIKYLGTVSGRDEDKINKMNLHLTDGIEVSCPGIKEFPLTLECKVIYHAIQDINLIPEDIRAKYYPQNTSSEDMLNSEPHYVFYGEIKKCYIIED